MLASPSTLIALLRTVSYGWQQETVAESARAINELGRELYDRVGVFVGHFSKVGRSLDTAVGAYNQALGSLETRLLVTARKFPEHGVSGDELDGAPPVERTPLNSRPPKRPEAATSSSPSRVPTPTPPRCLTPAAEPQAARRPTRCLTPSRCSAHPTLAGVAGNVYPSSSVYTW